MFCSFKYHFLCLSTAPRKRLPECLPSPPPRRTAPTPDPIRDAVAEAGVGEVFTSSANNDPIPTAATPPPSTSQAAAALALARTARGSEGVDGGLPEGASFSHHPRSKPWERPPRSPLDGRRVRGDDEVACGEARGGHAHLSGLQDDEGAGRGGWNE